MFIVGLTRGSLAPPGLALTPGLHVSALRASFGAGESLKVVVSILVEMGRKLSGILEGKAMGF